MYTIFTWIFIANLMHAIKQRSWIEYIVKFKVIDVCRNFPHEYALPIYRIISKH